MCVRGCGAEGNECCSSGLACDSGLQCRSVIYMGETGTFCLQPGCGGPNEPCCGGRCAGPLACVSNVCR